jgi:hypothetical protein
VLAQNLEDGSTVEVDRETDGEGEDQVKITIIKGARKAVAVGAGESAGEGGEEPAGSSEPAGDLPDEPDVLPDVPDAPPEPEPEDA